MPVGKYNLENNALKLRKGYSNRGAFILEEKVYNQPRTTRKTKSKIESCKLH